jgi:hypothetical protein
MSIFDDVKRFFWLHDVGCVTSDDPIELLQQLFNQIDKGSGWYTAQLQARVVQYESRIAELTTKLEEANKRVREVEHTNVCLEEGLKRDYLSQRVKKLEEELATSRSRTRDVEHLAVLLEEKTKSHSPKRS